MAAQVLRYPGKKIMIAEVEHHIPIQPERYQVNTLKDRLSGDATRFDIVQYCQDLIQMDVRDVVNSLITQYDGLLSSSVRQDLSTTIFASDGSTGFT
jgi:hypothetical protein